MNTKYYYGTLNCLLLMKKINLTLNLLLVFIICQAQEKSFTRNSFLTAGLSQVNEDANFGLVFSGPGINSEHRHPV